MVDSANQEQPTAPGASARRYLLVCRGPNCKAQGSTEVRERLRALVEAARREGAADGAGPDVVVLPYTCFDRCGRGPNVVVYPDEIWYEAVGEADAPDVARHALGGEPADHLRAEVPARHAAEYHELIAEAIPELEAEALNRKRPPKKGWWPFSR